MLCTLQRESDVVNKVGQMVLCVLGSGLPCTQGLSSHNAGHRPGQDAVYHGDVAARLLRQCQAAIRSIIEKHDVIHKTEIRNVLERRQRRTEQHVTGNM